MSKEINIYRKIWVANHGTIPTTPDGRKYHVHHIDRDRTNNDIDNLMCYSPLDHFLVHLEAEEYQAANAIYMGHLSKEEQEQYKHLDLPKLAANQRDNSNIGFNNPETYNKMIALQQERILSGTFHLQSGEIQRKSNLERLQNGTHNFATKENAEVVSKRNRSLLEQGKHPFQTIDQSKIQNDKVSNGTHHFLTEEHSKRVSAQNKEAHKNGTLSITQFSTCVYCNDVGRGFGFHSKHNIHCVNNPNNLLEECKYCLAKRHPSVILRYHNEKCRSK